MARNATSRPSDSACENEDSPLPAPLSATGYLRLHQIIGRPARKGQPAIAPIIPVSRSTWWAGVKSGRYPPSTHVLGERITAWRAEDIRQLLDEQSRAWTTPSACGVDPDSPPRSA